jgi:hypothetical protein
LENNFTVTAYTNIQNTQRGSGAIVEKIDDENEVSSPKLGVKPSKEHNSPPLKQVAPHKLSQQHGKYNVTQWLDLAWRSARGEESTEVTDFKHYNRTNASSTAAFFDGVGEAREKINRPLAQFKAGLHGPIDNSRQQINSRLESLDLSGLERASLHVADVGLSSTSIGIDLFVPGSMDQIGGDLLATAAGIKGAQVAHRIAEARRIGYSLGANPFKGKTFGQIDRRLRQERFGTVGKNPAEGRGAYFHPESGRKYYLDQGGDIYSEGQELSHVDIHRRNVETGKNIEEVSELPSGSKLTEPKRKYPLGDQLIDPTKRPPTQQPPKPKS